MARQNRRDVFSPLEISTVHCVQRAVRRAHLCGFDPLTRKSFEHRREWIRKRLEFLAGHFGIDFLGYSIMGNHLHVVLRNRPDVVSTWSDEEVARRIWYLFPKRKDAQGRALEPRPAELKALVSSQKRLKEYRLRLSDVSWLMRLLAEKIARISNKEDDCKGRFWEGRFKCQPLLDEASLLSCMAYVDLNPVRAGIAATPETSDYTSVQDRIEAEKSSRRASDRKFNSGSTAARRDGWLSPVPLKAGGIPGPDPSKSGQRASDKGCLPMSLESYLSLVDWTGRQLAHDKCGKIPASCAPILQRLGLAEENWCALVGGFGHLFRRVAGSAASLATSASARGLHHRQSSGGATLLGLAQ